MVDLDAIDAAISWAKKTGNSLRIYDEEIEDMAAELRTLRARVAELERDARLGAVVREAVGTFGPSEVESVEDITISDDGEPDGCREVIIISDEQASILSEIADALRAEEWSDQ